MSRTLSESLIQEGLIALREIAQRDVPGAPRDTRSLRLTYRSPLGKGLYHAYRPQDLYKHHPEFQGSDGDSLEKYKQRVSAAEPPGGIPSVYHRDGNFNEYRPDMYKDPKTARKHRDIMLKHGGLKTSTGSILAMDADYVDDAIKNAIKK